MSVMMVLTKSMTFSRLFIDFLFHLSDQPLSSDPSLSMSVFPPPPPPSSSTYFWEFKDCPSSCALSAANGGVGQGSAPTGHMTLDSHMGLNGPMTYDGHMTIDGPLDGVDRTGGYINGARDSGILLMKDLFSETNAMRQSQVS